MQGTTTRLLLDMTMQVLLVMVLLQLISFSCYAFAFPRVSLRHKHPPPPHHHKQQQQQQQQQQQAWHQHSLPPQHQGLRVTSHMNPNDSTSSSSSASSISNWVVENLESNGTAIITSSSSSVKAGEDDTLPLDGLVIGPMRILAANAPYNSHHYDANSGKKEYPIRLLLGRNGWGTGVHPSTRLCLEWLCMEGVMSRRATTAQDQLQEHEKEMDNKDNNTMSLTDPSTSTTSATTSSSSVVMDYGCGSGILSIAALHLGASSVIGVDIEAEALVTAERNVQLNGFVPQQQQQKDVDDDSSSGIRTVATLSSSAAFFQPYHTREVLPYQFSHQDVSICVANILIGQLVRPSMIAALITNIQNGGLLCFSGIRPWEVDSLKTAYAPHVDEWLDNEYYAELSADDTVGSTESYGFNVGSWARVVGRVRNDDAQRQQDIRAMSELAVS